MFLEKNLQATLAKRKLGEDGPPVIAPSGGGEEEEMSSSQPDAIAVELLDSSSPAIRKAVGRNLHLVFSEEDDSNTVQFTRPELSALILLARSKNTLLANMACEFIENHLELIPRGKLTTSQVLEHARALLDFGMSRQHTNVTSFALEIGTAVAREGEIWSERVARAWQVQLNQLLLDADIALDFRVQILRCAAALSGSFTAGCLKSISMYHGDAALVSLACESLLKSQASDGEDAQSLWKREEDVCMLLHCARDFGLEHNYLLSAQILRVLHSKSPEQSARLCDLFEECEVMDTINTLYRAPQTEEFSAGKLEIALFLEALLVDRELDVERKVHLCECGIIVRLIRLASPSSSSSNSAEEDGSVFLPAVRTLHELAKAERIGARIVLAGGLGPLFSHANSNRNTRAEAKQALAALGVTNLGAVVESWIKTFGASKAAADEQKLTPLADIVLFNGKQLLLTEPPTPDFFATTVNDPEAVLGRGAFSTVYKSRWRDGYCAVKRLTKAAAQDPGFAEEIRVLARIPAHPNIIGLYGVYLMENECLICSELGGPTLSSVAGKLTWRQRVHALFGIAEALRHLHGLDPCILHMDLKASNVLLVNGVAKLCDFGLAVELRRGFEFLLPGEHGTIQYMAPEVMREDNVELAKGFDVGAEVYSFAMIMWEVAHPGRIPWQGESFPEIGMELDITGAIRKAVLSGRRPHCEQIETWPPGYQELMEMCWKKHSADRPTFVGNFFFGDGEKASSTNNVICSVVLRKMLGAMDRPRPVEEPDQQPPPVSRWPSLRRVIAAAKE